MSRFICIDGEGSLVQAKLLSKSLQKQGENSLVISGLQLGGPAGYFIKRYHSGIYGKASELNAYHVAKIFGLTFIDINESITRLLDDGFTIICYDFVGSAVISAAQSINYKPSRNGFYLWCDQYFYQSLGLPRPGTNILLAGKNDMSASELVSLQPKDYSLVSISEQFGVAKTQSHILSLISKAKTTQIEKSKIKENKTTTNTPTKKTKPKTKISKPSRVKLVKTDKKYASSLSKLEYKKTTINEAYDAVKLMNYKPINELELGLSISKDKNPTFLQKQKATKEMLKRLKSRDSTKNKMSYDWQIYTSAHTLGDFLRMGFSKNITLPAIASQLSKYHGQKLSSDRNIDFEPSLITPEYLGQLTSFKLSLSFTQMVRLLERSVVLKNPELNEILKLQLELIEEVHPLAHNVLTQ